MEIRKKRSHELSLTRFMVLICTILFFTSLLTFYENYIGSFYPNMLNKERVDGKINVACVGDSLTYGILVYNPYYNSYPAQLEKMLGSDYNVSNFGFSGRCATNSSDRPYKEEKIYQYSLEYNPDIVIIMLGSNDSKAYNWVSKEEYIKDYSSLIDTYLNLPSKPEVYLGIMPPTFKIFSGKYPYGIDSDTINNEVIPAIYQISKDKNLPVIDFHSQVANSKELFPDYCHLNRKGAKILAETAYKAILTK